MKFFVLVALVLAIASAIDVLPVLKHQGRIAGGQNADIADFNYQVGLALKKGIFDSYWCGGSLIAREWVLTAAHCMKNVYKLTVYLGGTQRGVADVQFDIVRNSDNVFVHEGFNGNTYRNDIALIKIPPVTFTDKIRPIRLSSCNDGTFPGDFNAEDKSADIEYDDTSKWEKLCKRGNGGTFPGDFHVVSVEGQSGSFVGDYLKKICKERGFAGDFHVVKTLTLGSGGLGVPRVQKLSINDADAIAVDGQIGGYGGGMAAKVQSSSCNDGTFPGDFATVSGWGRMGDNAIGIPSTLQSLTLRIMSNAECARIYSSAIVTDGKICLATNDDVVMRSTCDGDSGGPLVLKGKQIGLVSFGAKKGCELGYPVAFTRISSYIDWIVAKTGITV